MLENILPVHTNSLGKQSHLLVSTQSISSELLIRSERRSDHGPRKLSNKFYEEHRQAARLKTSDAQNGMPS